MRKKRRLFARVAAKLRHRRIHIFEIVVCPLRYHQRWFVPFWFDFGRRSEKERHRENRSPKNKWKQIKQNEKNGFNRKMWAYLDNHGGITICLAIFFADAADRLRLLLLYSLWRCAECMGAVCSFAADRLLPFALSRRRMHYDYWHNMLPFFASVICFHVRGMRHCWWCDGRQRLASSPDLRFSDFAHLFRLHLRTECTRCSVPLILSICHSSSCVERPASFHLAKAQHILHIDLICFCTYLYFLWPLSGAARSTLSAKKHEFDKLR